MLQPVPVRLAVLTSSAVVLLAAGAAVAPSAHAGETPLPPGLRSLPDPSAAPMKAVPLAKPHGRKLR